MPTKKPIIMPGLNGGPSLESSSRLPQAPEAKGKGPKKIIVPPLNFVTIELKIVGVTSLICNRFQKKMADHLPDAETPRPDSPMASVPRKLGRSATSMMTSSRASTRSRKAATGSPRSPSNERSSGPAARLANWT
jgi:hypothetical protein